MALKRKILLAGKPSKKRNENLRNNSKYKPEVRRAVDKALVKNIPEDARVSKEGKLLIKDSKYHDRALINFFKSILISRKGIRSRQKRGKVLSELRNGE